MNPTIRTSCLLSILLVAVHVTSGWAGDILRIHVDQPGPVLHKTQYGVFFEEISHAGDGGLYAELVNNRSFEESTDSVPHWTFFSDAKTQGQMSLEFSELLNEAQSQALTVEISGAGGVAGVANEGYWGMNMVKDRIYDLSFFAKSDLPPDAVVTAKLQSADGETTYATATFHSLVNQWNRYSGHLKSNANDPNGRLALEVKAGGAGRIRFDVVSLFPPTWKGRPNGLRPDLAEMIAQMRPGVIRFPGGSYVSTLPAKAPRWLNELGPIETRTGHPGTGKTNHWGYHNTSGFGFHEYLQFAEDLGAEPMYVFGGGADSRSEMEKPETYLTGAAIDQLIEEILAGIEYANGSTDTVWGARRAANGHPKPFNMNYVQIGNENFQAPFHENYIRIHSAIKAKHPMMRIVWGGDWIGNNQHGYASNGIMPEGSTADLIDEHFYKKDDWFYRNTDRYHPKQYPRDAERAAKIFIGEASAWEDNLDAALKETAFLLGAERYSDKVVMAVYAPLLANVNAKNWAANAINFDSSRAYGTPSYHAQVMLGNHTGDFNIGVSGTEGLLAGKLYVNANLVRSTGEVIIKAVHPGAQPLACDIHLQGIEGAPTGGRAIVMSASDLKAENSLENPMRVAPVEQPMQTPGVVFQHVFPAHSFTVLRLAFSPPASDAR